MPGRAETHCTPARRRATADRGGRAPAALLVGALLVLAGCASAPERPPSLTQQQGADASQRAARALQRGDLAQARAQYLLALAAAQALQDPDATGAALLNLTLVDSRRGDLAAASAHVDRLLADPTLQAPALQARAATRKALLLLDLDQPDAALGWADRARNRCAPPCALAPVLDNLQAYVSLTRGDAAAALAQARRAAENAGASGQTGEQASALRLAGRAATRLGDTTSAAEALALALQLDRQLGQPDRVALDLLYAAENEDRRGNPAAAATLYERAATVYAASGDARSAASLRARLAGR